MRAMLDERVRLLVIGGRQRDPRSLGRCGSECAASCDQSHPTSFISKTMPTGDSTRCSDCSRESPRW